MKHVNKFTLNEWSDYEVENNIKKDNKDFLGKLLLKLGIEVTDDSEIIPRTKFGKFLCNMAVRDGLFMETGNTYRLNQK